MLRTRVLSACVFAPLLLGVLFAGGIFLKTLCIVLSLGMFWEFERMTLRPLAGISFRERAFGYVATLLMSLVHLNLLHAFTSLVPVLLLLVVMTFVLMAPTPIEGVGVRMALLILGIYYCGSLIAYWSRLRELEHGLAWALMAILGTWASDTGGYFAGRWFGKHKLYPIASPKKTREGFVGSILASAAAVWGIDAYFALSLTWVHVLSLGCLIACVATLGDLCESLLKRYAQVKDSSQLIPGHGGLLDRFDAAMFVMPVLYLFVLTIGY